MTKKKRLIVLTPRFPFPLYGGDVLRIYRMCETLSLNWDITLLSLCQTDAEYQVKLPADSPFKEVHRVSHPKWKSYLNVIKAIFSTQALQLAYYQSAQFKSTFDSLKNSHDMVLCHLLRTAPYACEFSGRRILELTDHLPLTYTRSNAVRRSTVSLKQFIYKFERDRIDAAQIRLTPFFDKVCFVSEIDRSAFLETSSMDSRKILVFPNGVSLEERPFKNSREGRKIAFIGNLQAMPNSDAVRHFANEILPIVTKIYTDTSLKIVGKIDVALKRQLEGNPKIEFAGPSPDLAEELSDCVLGICPVRIGAGVQNKMLDYMALGLPAVTTQLGAEGIDGRANHHYFVAKDDSSFAASIIELFNNPTLRVNLAANSRKLIEESYSWQAKLQGMSRTFED